MNAIRKLESEGQSPWLDFIRREMITSGELARLVREDNLGGVTSNPAIFEKAIGQSSDYDNQIEQLVGRGMEADAIYEALAQDDIRAAAVILRTVYEATGGEDGYVSLEVSPYLARDTEGTLAEARRLWLAVDRPNLMIKVPGTEQGLPAVQQLIAEGISVNVTLLFSVERYEQVVEAYLSGLERLVASGGDPARVASVASFFISRLDAAVDDQLNGLDFLFGCCPNEDLYIPEHELRGSRPLEPDLQRASL